MYVCVLVGFMFAVHKYSDSELNRGENFRLVHSGIDVVCEWNAFTFAHKIQFRDSNKTIVCALWFLATIKILFENMDVVRFRNVMNGWSWHFRSFRSFIWFGVEFSHVFYFDKVSKLHINMMPVHLLMYDNQLIIIRAGERTVTHSPLSVSILFLKKIEKCHN